MIFTGKEAVGENYRRMFSSMSEVELKFLERFATEDRVVDDTVATFTLVGDGMTNAPAAVGSKIELRIVHTFEMRDGLIARERVYEMWRAL